jgi:GTPase SAR1 family protein
MIFLRLSLVCGCGACVWSGVGKTSVVLRYVQGVYSLDQPSTIGASFMTKRMCVVSHAHTRSLSSPSLTLNQSTNQPTNNQPTQKKSRFLEDWKVKLQIWDTAGQERCVTLCLAFPASVACSLCSLVADCRRVLFPPAFVR